MITLSVIGVDPLCASYAPPLSRYCMKWLSVVLVKNIMLLLSTLKSMGYLGYNRKSIVNITDS